MEGPNTQEALILQEETQVGVPCRVSTLQVQTSQPKGPAW